VHVRDRRGIFVLDLERVMSIRTKQTGSGWLPEHRRHHLEVVTIEGRRFSPILQPDGSDRPTEARRFNEVLTEYRARRGLPREHEL